MDDTVELARWVVVLVIVYTISLHELGHAYAATYFGDPTPGRHGRLTFNPLVQLHIFYSVILPLMTYALYGWPFGWAYCPVDPTRFKRPLRDNALTSLAGPLVNLAVVLVCAGVLWVPQITPWGSFNQAVFFWVGLWNLILAGFNLMPLPGLDGYDVFRAVLPLPVRGPLDQVRRMGWLPLILAMAIGSTIFGRYLITPLRDGYLYLLPEGIQFSASIQSLR